MKDLNVRNKLESGQGMVEYALILIGVAIFVIVVCMLLPAYLIMHWPAVVIWGGNLVDGVKAGDSKAIFVAIVLALLLLWFFFGRRKS